MVTGFLLPCWVLPLPLGILSAVSTLGKYGARSELGFYCDYTGKDRSVAVYLSTSIYVLAPTIVMTLCYVVMIYKLLRLRFIVSPESTVNMEKKCQAIPQKTNVEKQTRLLLTIFLPTAVFFVFFYTVLVVNKTTANLILRKPEVALWLRMLYHSGTPTIAVRRLSTLKSDPQLIKSVFA
jgi:hypothetical protein